MKNKRNNFISPTELVKSWEEKTENESAKRPQIILNRIKTPDGTILTSYSVHDYRTHIDKNGLEYMVDGGLEYLRRNVHQEYPYEELSVTSEAPFEQIRESLHWGSYGKYGDQPLHYIPLYRMTNAHIQAILDHNIGGEWFRKYLRKELSYRKRNNIIIND